MNTKMIIAVVSLVLLIGGIALLAGSSFTSNAISSNKDFLEGTITNIEVSPGKFEGISTYDRNCVGQPITECDGGINTEEYGELNFHYSHDMSVQPCIHMHGPEKLMIEILDSSGAARVYRT